MVCSAGRAAALGLWWLAALCVCTLASDVCKQLSREGCGAVLRKCVWCRYGCRKRRFGCRTIRRRTSTTIAPSTRRSPHVRSGSHLGTPIDSSTTVFLKAIDHGAYLGVCGNDALCGNNKNNVYAYTSRRPRTRFQLQKVDGDGAFANGDVISMMQPTHSAYIGVCGNSTGCIPEAVESVFAYENVTNRTEWELVIDGGGNLTQESTVYFKQRETGTYLCVCGKCDFCDRSMHCVWACDSKSRLAEWRIEPKATTPETPVFLKAKYLDAYIGVCGTGAKCSNNVNGVVGYSARNHRTVWVMERERSLGKLGKGDFVYLKQTVHGTYLGVCGDREGCPGAANDTAHGVFAYSGKDARTRWEVEPISISYSGELSVVYLKQPTYDAYLCACGSCASCEGSSHCISACTTKEALVEWSLIPWTNEGQLDEQENVIES